MNAVYFLNVDRKSLSPPVYLDAGVPTPISAAHLALSAAVAGSMATLSAQASADTCG